MTNDRHLTSLSKFLSLVLRHEPGRIGITLDDAGWTDIDALLSRCAAAGRPLDRSTLRRIVDSSDKQRFALSDDGARIRANQGHSVTVDLRLVPVEPPALLYHGTAEHAVPSILASGLNRGARHHVHLSESAGTASAVGRRNGAPVLLRVAAGRMHNEGHTFYRSDNGVWLCDTVPPSFIEVLP